MLVRSVGNLRKQIPDARSPLKGRLCRPVRSSAGNSHGFTGGARHMAGHLHGIRAGSSPGTRVLTVTMARVKAYQQETQLRTTGGLSIKDITEEVQEAVVASGIKNGICSVYSPHTTCSVRVNEFETGFLEDFALLLKKLVPSDSYYAHDDWDRRTENVCPEDMDFGNGHSHCMSMLLGPAGESIPVRDGELCLGTWQRVLFLELDRERDRRWLVQVVGV